MYIHDTLTTAAVLAIVSAWANLNDCKLGEVCAIARGKAICNTLMEKWEDGLHIILSTGTVRVKETYCQVAALSAPA